MDSVEALLRRYDEAASHIEAEPMLDLLAGQALPDGLRVGDLYDDLATLAADDRDFAAAVRLQHKALDGGCQYRELGREMLAWYLLKDGQTATGEALFDQLMAERGPDDVELLMLIGNARFDAGRGDDALAAFDSALSAAMSHDDPSMVARARAERWPCRQELGLVPDEDDRLAPRFDFEGPVEWAMSWFPRNERGAALSRWPDLHDDLADVNAYCRRIERHLREVHGVLGRRPAVAPLRVEDLVAFAAREGLDPGDGLARSRYAAEQARRGRALEWPPGRNDPCWCGSGRKYKRCCAEA